MSFNCAVEESGDLFSGKLIPGRSAAARRRKAAAVSKNAPASCPALAAAVPRSLNSSPSVEHASAQLSCQPLRCARSSRRSSVSRAASTSWCNTSGQHKANISYQSAR
jgi:hypothetical protein